MMNNDKMLNSEFALTEDNTASVDPNSLKPKRGRGRPPGWSKNLASF
jgi:hypothetical protein